MSKRISDMLWHRTISLDQPTTSEHNIQDLCNAIRENWHTSLCKKWLQCQFCPTTSLTEGWQTVICNRILKYRIDWLGRLGKMLKCAIRPSLYLHWLPPPIWPEQQQPLLFHIPYTFAHPMECTNWSNLTGQLTSPLLLPNPWCHWNPPLILNHTCSRTSKSTAKLCLDCEMKDNEGRDCSSEKDTD